MGWFVQLFLILEKLKEKKCNTTLKKKNLKFQATNDMRTSQSCKTNFLYNNPFGPWLEFFI